MIITNKFNSTHNLTQTHQGVDVVFSSEVKFIQTLWDKLKLKVVKCIYVGTEPTGMGNYCVFRCVDQTNKIKFIQMAHFKEIFIKVGDSVWANQKIGIQGETGNAKGIHVHIELSEAVDPEKYLV